MFADHKTGPVTAIKLTKYSQTSKLNSQTYIVSYTEYEGTRSGTVSRLLAKRNGIGQSQRNGTAFQVLVEREERKNLSELFVKTG